MDRSTLESALSKKGFVSDDSRDHRYFHHEVDGKKTGIKTKISHGTKYKSLDASLQAKIKIQLHLDTSNELRDFANCPMTQDQYLAKLRKKDIPLP